MADASADASADRPRRETVGEVAELYLGNLLFALELAAMSLEKDGKPEDAAYYRALARKLAGAQRVTA